MIRKSTLALVAAIAVVGIASPAFAQTFDREMGTGNIASINNGATAPQRQSGLDAYAMVPDARAAGLTGGGSRGYEELLKSEW
jgi:hypothetical protein